MKQFTPTTLHRKAELECDLETSRKRGFAIDRAEGAEGIHCVAVAIRDSYGQPLGAVTVMGPASRVIEERFEELADLCLGCRDRIETELQR